MQMYKWNDFNTFYKNGRLLKQKPQYLAIGQP